MTNPQSIESMEKRILFAASTGDASALFNVSSLLDPTNAIHLSKIGDYATGVFDEGAGSIRSASAHSSSTAPTMPSTCWT